jgi:hypothetical protein
MRRDLVVREPHRAGWVRILRYVALAAEVERPQASVWWPPANIGIIRLLA